MTGESALPVPMTDCQKNGEVGMPFRKRLMAALGGVAAAGAFPGARAAWELNLPPPSTPIAAEILGLHNAIMLVCLVIFVVVFGVMFYSLYAHRKSRGHEPATFSHSNKVEVIWTVIPFLILVGLAIPSTATLLRMEDTTDAELTIKITGYQWKWRYEYPEQDISFFSTLATSRSQIENREEKGEHYLREVDNPVVLPAGKKVRLLLTANDVIHAWWIPKFGVKKDAIPGFVNEMWVLVDEPGTYRGQCVELCGKDHGFMPIVAEVLSPEDFDAWVRERQNAQAVAPQPPARDWDKAELLAKGEQVYTQCAACQGDDGQGIANAFPAIAGSAVATGPVDEHVSLVLNGRAGTAMQAFKDQLSDVELAAVITYQRNSFGNGTGDVVQPATVQTLRRRGG